MKHTSETWPPAPVQPHLECEADPDGVNDWLTANDIIREVTRRDYAIVSFAALWLLLACIAIAFHHRLPAGAIKNVTHIVRTVLS